ncbi:TPA: hypothetical protein ACX6NV_000549 [Photobacterium damselae]
MKKGSRGKRMRDFDLVRKLVTANNNNNEAELYELISSHDYSLYPLAASVVIECVLLTDENIKKYMGVLTKYQKQAEPHVEGFDIRGKFRSCFLRDLIEKIEASNERTKI